MDNQEFLEELKFGQGDGNLQYYVYNWRCPEMDPNQVCYQNIRRDQCYLTNDCFFLGWFSSTVNKHNIWVFQQEFLNLRLLLNIAFLLH